MLRHALAISLALAVLASLGCALVSGLALMALFPEVTRTDAYPHILGIAAPSFSGRGSAAGTRPRSRVTGSDRALYPPMSTHRRARH